MTGGRVFIVDDNAANLNLLASILREAGHEVRMANNARRALNAIRVLPPEIVMLDITMPDLDGYEVCARLKADPITRNTAVIFISALDDVVDKVRAFRAGGVDYVTKPFEAAEVTARVETQLRLGRLRAELERKNLELEERRRALDDDLQQAFAFQRTLLEAPSRWRDLDVHALYLPAELVSGDLYVAHETPDGRLRALLVDTPGHGVQASLRTMVVKTVYERLRGAAVAPAKILEALNDDLAATHAELTMRCAACCFDIDAGGAVRYANAGMLPLRLLAGAGARERVSTGAFLGMVQGVRFDDVGFELPPGSRLVAYTDGLVEQWGADGERIDEAALFATLGSGASAGDGAAALAARLGELRAAGAQTDDITVLVIGRPG